MDRWSFNITLFIAGVFGLSAGGAPNFIALASLLAVLGVGVGGNLPVDSAVFLDFIPGSHQYLLTILSIWWSIGQVVADLVGLPFNLLPNRTGILMFAQIAWPLIANFSCPPHAETCTRAENMGWRYLLFTLGGMTLLLWGIRFAVFPLEESPRFLIGQGRDEEAVAIVQRIATFNGTTTTLTVAQLKQAGDAAVANSNSTGKAKRKVLSESSVFRLTHIRALFETPKLAWSTSLLIFLWCEDDTDD